jgi:hypothetical protein
MKWKLQRCCGKFRVNTSFKTGRQNMCVRLFTSRTEDQPLWNTKKRIRITSVT